MASVNRGIKAFLVMLIRAYRLFISGWLGPCCRFEPSCSAYGEEAITRHGCIKGCWLLLRRLLRCHPWHAGGIDPVPLLATSRPDVAPLNQDIPLTHFKSHLC